ncbi:MAG: DUF2252 family protein [Candidatus Sericytochromatia bacterium]
MKKVISSLLLSSFLLSSCGDNTKNINTDDNISTFSKSDKTTNRGIFSIVEKNNSEYKKRNPELIRLKYQAMSESSFSFYRATAYLYYMDLSKTSLNSSINIPLQGDLHLDNIGTYFSSNGKVYYDMNDFDDSFTGSYTYDLARLLTSIYLAANEMNFSRSDAEDFSKEFFEHFQNYLKVFTKNKNLINEPFTNLTKYAQKAVDKTFSNSYQDFISEISSNGKFIYSDKIKKIPPEEFNNVNNAIKTYLNTNKNSNIGKVKDIAFYIAGKGSLGRYRYIILFDGSTTKTNDDLVLEIKEATQPSSTINKTKLSGNQAQRVIQATKYFLSYTDNYYGITKIGNIDFYVRRVMPDEKVNLKKIDKNSEFKEHIKTIAAIIAKAQAKSGKGEQILNDLDSKKDLISDFAKSYSKQVMSDYEEFKSSF